MARIVRSTLQPGWFHCVNRGVNKQLLFLDDMDYQFFQKTMKVQSDRTNVEIPTFCLMPNHWHMVVQCKEIDEMSAFFQKLSFIHTQFFRSKYRKIGQGPIYQGRYKSYPIKADESFGAVSEYVNLNPVRAGLVNFPDEWRWGSAYLDNKCQGRA